MYMLLAFLQVCIQEGVFLALWYPCTFVAIVTVTKKVKWAGKHSICAIIHFHTANQQSLLACVLNTQRNLCSQKCIGSVGCGYPAIFLSLFYLHITESYLFWAMLLGYEWERHVAIYSLCVVKLRAFLWSLSATHIQHISCLGENIFHQLSNCCFSPQRRIRCITP